MGDSPDDTDLPPWDDEQEEEAQEQAGPSAAELEAAGQSAMFGDAAPPPVEDPAVASEAAPASVEQPAAAPAPPPANSGPYRVLARKYRPQTFSELIGQEPMVKTLANAIARDRLAHAFLMTGVRGVGKTSTARLIAKALNCVGPDGQGGPTIDPCGVCEPCQAIAEGRHIDVIEMDAASHTGVDDVREIIEAVRYAAVSARYKIYIIDEVHMLSRNAFNALLKTLEEPPAHVKFLFATTEVDKLPVTVLSRCQRFDLRRIPAELLHQHFASVCRQEGVEAEDEAIAMVAAAAEGSARDGLSILDQAIAHADMDAGDGATMVTAAKVREMLGLADKGAQRRLFAHLLNGDPQGLLAAVNDQYSLGVEPLALLRGLMELTHRIAVAQLGEGEVTAVSEEERQDIAQWADRLSAGQVHRLWQLLLKGHDEVKGAPDPLVAAQMALLRILHAADMPDPGKLEKLLKEAAERGVGAVQAPAAPGAAASSQDGPQAAGSMPDAHIEWTIMCDRVEQEGLLRMGQVMRDWIRIIELRDGYLRFTHSDEFDEDILPELRDALLRATGERWDVAKGAGEGQPSLRERAEAAQAADRARIESHPLVQATKAAFPAAELLDAEEMPVGEARWNRRAG
ncbi:DNA polymerase III subunit gamma/tau [Alteraurantiacibacter aquimixticola]|uniref:DNA polymerase III subunit gamma/tau n=1 Tax=Alteraurantiacibacter aquimixticola TaxID=2489173 RepID=A0A4T3F3R8_9SPHN|nr:DNA polymerase III subunit gamma/tau [Alteraurantiacibacter aquimixticola]TIX51926.1 DNA polymerase III subunit gamma/tau [Alteraurantiacibacter aquimixticola]